VNLVGHLVVGLRLAGVGPTHDVAFGVMLPDLGSMAGLRADRSSLPAAVAEGVRLHHLTDAAFHGQPWFAQAVAADRQALQEAGLARGAARACAHVGFELLLDGLLLEDRSVAESVGVALDALAAERLGAGAGGQPDRWEELFRRLRDSRRLTDSYSTPEGVAHRLRWVLARRPRLALEQAHLDPLVERLQARRARLEAVAPVLVETVVERARAGSGAPGRPT
jgi:hypothetical protein